MDLSKQQPLTVDERKTVLRGLAEGRRLFEVVELVKQEHDRRISGPCVAHYRDSEKWKAAIDAEREAMAAELARLPLSQAYVRQSMRAELIDTHRATAGALGAVRGLLLDAAKEVGDISEDGGSSAVQLTIQLVQQVLNLPTAALKVYVETGALDPGSYLPDVVAAQKLADNAQALVIEAEVLLPAEVGPCFVDGSDDGGLR